MRLGDTLLAVNEDYTVSYSDNTDVGMATVTVAGTGNYYGTALATFYIVTATNWNFDVQQIPTTPQFADFTDSAAIWNVCPSQDESLLLVGTGTGYYARVGTWEDFDPSTFVQAGVTSTGVESRILHTPDGIHYLTGGGSVVEMRIASTAYDVTTIPSERNSYYLRSYIAGGCISPDGLHVLLSGYYGEASKSLVSIDLATPWDLSTATNEHTVAVDSKGPIFVNLRNGKQIAMAGNPSYGVKDISLITLNTAWDVSDGIASTSTKTLDLSPTESYLQGIAVNAAGTKMIVTRSANSQAQAALINLVA